MNTAIGGYLLGSVSGGRYLSSLKMKTNKHNIFATPIWHTNILNEHINNEIVDHILQKSKNEPGVGKTNVGGWQSDSIVKDSKFSPLFSEINKIIENLDLKINKIEISQAWCNVNNKNDWNVIHNHGWYNLSAIYFAKKPENSGKLGIRDPRAILTSTWGGWANKIYNMYNENCIIYLNSKVRDLIIFPSFLDHYVTPSDSDEERITIAVDIMCF